MDIVFDNVYTEAADAGSISTSVFFISLLVAVILGVISTWIYSYKNVHSKQFFVTLAVLPALVASVIFLVNGNLGTSVAVAGTFSLVRFRSAPAGSKELLGLFQAMAIGLAVGTGYVGFAVVLTIFFSAVIFGLEKLKIGKVRTTTKLLTVKSTYGNADYQNQLKDFLNSNFKSYDMSSFHFNPKKQVTEMSYVVEVSSQMTDLELMQHCQELGNKFDITISNEATKKNIL